MKKTIYLTFLLMLSFTISNAQTIPNSGFENWTSMGSYYDPNSWSTLNDMTTAMSIYTCVKGTPGSVGAAYIKLTTKTITGLGNVCAYAVCGTIDPGTFLPKSGFAFTGRPQSLTGNWQYMASGADHGFIGVILTKWNNSLSMRDTIAYAYEALSGMALSWANFSIQLSYMSGDDPDSCMIVLSASEANNVAPVNGSYLYADELMFAGTVTGISESPSTNNISISPNPASDYIVVNLSGLKDKFASLKIYDVQGKLVKSVDRAEVGSNTSVQISDIPKGNYVLKISTGTGTTSKNFIKQ